MSDLAGFQAAYLAMGEAPSPDSGMSYAVEEGVCRYVGEGDETHFYSLSLTRPSRDAATLAAVVAREKARAGRRPHEWKEYDFPDAPALGAVLASHGYVVDRRAALMFAPVGFAVAPAPGVAVERVATDAQVDALGSVGLAAFGRPMGSALESVRLGLREPRPLVEAFLCRVDGVAACGGWVKYYGAIGYLFGGGSVPALRGRGAYRALVAARLAAAKARGARFVVSECSPDSERVLDALGFARAGKALRHVLKPA
jgi:hypothetical protein